MWRPLTLALLCVLAVPAFAGAEIRILDPSGAVVATPAHDNGADLLGWTDDGAELWLSRRGRAFRVPSSGGAEARGPVLGGATQIGPSGRSAVADDPDFASREVVRVADGRVVATLASPDGASFISHIAWSSDGHRGAVLVGDGVLVFDTDTGVTLTKVPLPGIRGSSLSAQAFSPDASSLAILNDRQVIGIDVATGATRPLATLPDDDWSAPAWGRAGTIAVTGDNRVRLIGAVT